MTLKSIISGIAIMQAKLRTKVLSLNSNQGQSAYSGFVTYISAAMYLIEANKS